MPLFIHVETTRSTNSFMAYAADTLPDHTVLYTYDQTAGRGQRGNTWLCPPGLNIAMSIVRKDLSIHAREQFIISEVSAVGTANALSELTGQGRRRRLRGRTGDYSRLRGCHRRQHIENPVPFRQHDVERQVCHDPRE